MNVKIQINVEILKPTILTCLNIPGSFACPCQRGYTLVRQLGNVKVCIHIFHSILTTVSIIDYLNPCQYTSLYISLTVGLHMSSLCCCLIQYKLYLL